MSLKAENKAQEIGKKSQAVRTRLINRTSKSGEMSRRGHPSLAMEVVQTVDMPHQLYIDTAEGPYLTDLDGNKIEHGSRFTLCGCTKSKKLPFCDGSHKG